MRQIISPKAQFNSYNPNFRCQFIFLILLFSSTSIAQIIISELLRDPIGLETQLCGGAALEFVELTNCGPDTFDITGCFISDGVQSDSILVMVDTLPNHRNALYGHNLLLPGQTALILDQNYRELDASHNCFLNIKVGTVLWECEDAELGNGLSSSDGVFIYRGTRHRLDSIIAAAFDDTDIHSDPTPGKLTLSVENQHEGISVVPKNCLHDNVQYVNGVENPTPGWFASLSNGWIIEYTFASGPYLHTMLPCSVKVKQVHPAKSLSTRWSITYGSHNASNTLTYGNITPINNYNLFTVNIPMDSNRYYISIGNSTREIDRSTVWIPSFSLRINELFPKSTVDEPEWFELVNLSPIPLNLKNWYFGYADDTVKICTSDFLITKDMFCIITNNKKLFLQKYSHVPNCIEPQQWYTLSNRRDTISLFTPYKQPVDTVSYDADDYNNWTIQSVERVDATKPGYTSHAFALSRNSTPCKPNSVVHWRNSTKTSVDVGPIPFTPNNDGKNDLFLIKCTIPITKTATISIVSFDGKVIKTFEGPLEPQYLWNGLDNRGRKVKNGPFFVIVSTFENGRNSVIRKKGVLWR